MEGSGQPHVTAAPSQAILDRIAPALPVVFAAAILAVLAAKLLLIWRINVNWDEFFYLSNIHALARGELDLLLQGAYTHLFRWIAASDAYEVDQIVVLRLLMWLLLVWSAWLLYSLARRFASPVAAAFAVLAFAASWPVLKHGASFRADSMLLPLTLTTLLFITRDGDRHSGSDVAAGLCLGAAFTLTTKAVFMFPVLLMMIALPHGAASRPDVFRAGPAIRRLALILSVAGLLSALLIAVHSTQLIAGAEPAGAFAARAVAAAILDVPIFPRGNYFRRVVMEDAIFWLAMLAGLLIAFRVRAYTAAGGILALLPVLFYRNAFPYYYPVMMAPAAILIALAADWIGRRSSPSWPRGFGLYALAVLGLLLMHHAWDGLMTLRFDEQQKQRSVVAAVHEVFPAPVLYIDHSGMIASFPKTNFFMSTWGVETYRRQGRDFMPELLASSRPPLLLVNHPVLQPGTPLFRQLSETDRRLLQGSYLNYWGPIRVAGVETELPAEGAVALRLPFAGRYRLASRASVRLDGKLLRHDETIEVGNAQVDIIASAAMAGTALTLKLIWADARDAPQRPPPQMPLYSPL